VSLLKDFLIRLLFTDVKVALVTEAVSYLNPEVEVQGFLNPKSRHFARAGGTPARKWLPKLKSKISSINDKLTV
jgi:hypothetical protein